MSGDGTKLCAFCGGDAAAYGGRLGRMQGPYNASKSGYEVVYVHHECAVWSPKTSQDADLKLRSVGTEVRRARNLKCSTCGRSGAAIGCRVPSCSKCYHLPCAIQQGCRFNFELYLMACPDHAVLFSKEPAGSQQAADSAGGPLAHLKLAGKRQRRQRYTPPAAAGGRDAGPAGGVRWRRRNTMTAAQLGDHVDAAKAAYQALAEELAGHDSSEPDEAVIAAKDAKRMRKATQHLAPKLLQRPPVAPGAAGPHHPDQRPHSQPHQLVEQQQQQQARSWQPPAGGFANIGGLCDVKCQLKEMVLVPLAYPQLMQQLGIQPPRGILLHGPPGTGKTAIVRALAAECAALTTQSSSSGTAVKPVALFARKGTDCLGKYAGDAELHLRLLFDMAAAAAPSIIFLDELDGLVPARSVRSSSSDQIFASVVSVLLALMDGVKDRGQVLVIGATNRPHSIDPALRRPGRFDREVYFNLPGQHDRQDILAVHTARWQPQPGQQLLRQLAAAADGWAGADLQSLAAAALLTAVRRASPHLISAIEGRQQEQQQQQLVDQQAQQQADNQEQQECQAEAEETHSTPVGAHNAATSPADLAAGGASAGVFGAGGDTPATADVPCSTTPAAAGLASPVEAQAAAAAAMQAGVAGTGAVGSSSVGFLAALTDFMSEQQQQQQQQPWLVNMAPVASADAQQQQLEEQSQPAAAAAAAAGAPAAVAGALLPQGQEAAAEPQGSSQGPAADVEMLDCEAAQPQPQPQQQQTCPAEAGPAQHEQGAPPDAREQQDSQVQQQQQQVPACPAGVPGSLLSALPALPPIEVLPADWFAALAAAGPPASKREMNSLACLNPAAPLAAPLAPLLLPAFAHVVVLLQRWLLLLAQGADALAAAAALAAAGAAGGGGPAGARQDQFQELLVQWGAVEQLPQPLFSEDTAAACGSCNSQGSSSHGGGVAGSSSQSASQLLLRNVGSSSPHCLLLSGHGPSGQPELAAAVLKLLGSCSAAAVHTLGLPGMLLLGDGDVCKGLVSGVGEAVGKVGRGQLLVLYMPRLELWAFEPGKRPPAAAVQPATTTAAAAAATVMSGNQAATAPQQQQAVMHVSRTLGRSRSAFKGRSGGMDGVMSSSGSSGSEDEHDSSSEDEDSSSSGGGGSGAEPGSSSSQEDAEEQLDSNNNFSTDAEAGDVTVAAGRQPACARRHQQQQQQQDRIRRRQQDGTSRRQQQQRLCLSAAWGVLEQQLAALSGQQGVLLLATCHLPVEQLPAEVQQLFGHVGKQQQEQQGGSAQRHAAFSGGAHSSSGVVQVCCPQSSSCSGGAAAAAAHAALSCALQQAAAAAVQHYQQQLAFLGPPQSSAQNQSPDRAAAHSTLPADTAAADADVAGVWPQQLTSELQYAAGQQGEEQQQQREQQQSKQQQEQRRQRQQGERQQEQQQQPTVSALQELNAAQQAQANYLFGQVQQQLQVLGSLLLRDPRIRMAKVRPPARQASSTQQQLDKLQAVLPLAGVCLKAVRGWYCQLDDFTADFTAAANRIRSVHAGQARYSTSVAAAAVLEDVVGVSCREAAQQLGLYDPANVKLLKAAAEARQNMAMQQQQQRQQQVVQFRQEQQQQLRELVQQQQPGLQGQLGTVSGHAAAQLRVGSTAEGHTEHASASGNAVAAAAADNKQQELVQCMQNHLQALAARHLEQWQQQQQQQQRGVPESGTGTCCWMTLHSAVHNFCRVAGSVVAAAVGTGNI